MKRLLLALAFLLAACTRQGTGTEAGSPAVTIVECDLLHTFESGERLFLCPPEATPATAVSVSATATAKASRTPTPTRTATPAAPTDTAAPPTPPSPTGQADTPVPVPSDTPAAFADPYPGAPACLAHSTSVFHGLWDGQAACHYDHEHGENPFTPEVAAAFPGFDLQALLGGVQIGHTNPSGPTENTVKHGGFKWQAQPETPHGCANGFEAAEFGVSAIAVLYHNFGDYATEFPADVHSAVALVRMCDPANPTDFGYLLTNTHQDYGQRISPYQGVVLPFPNNPQPPYPSNLGPYLSLDCFGTGIVGCRESREFVLSHNANANSIWTSKGGHTAPSESKLFRLLFRIRDNYQLLDSSDLEYPLTFAWLCSADGGLTYAALPGCRYNNSAYRVHEVAGDIPEAWDNLAGFDTDPRIGRVTGEGFTTRFGDLNLACAAPGLDCHPVKLVSAFVGRYGGQLIDDKINQFTPEAQPEHDIYFCAGVVCAETDPGAVSSGWIGAEN